MSTLREMRREYVDARLDGARWHRVTAVGVDCDVLEAGAGTPLVLVHGGIGTCTDWMPILPRLARRYRCYAVERPSNGASDEFDYAGHTGDRQEHVTRVVADLFDGIGIDRAPVVANSMGALFSLGFAARHPERVEHLVMVGAPAGHEDHRLPLPLRLMAGRFTGPVIAWLTRRSGPDDARRIQAQLCVAHPGRLDADHLALAAATGRRNADAWHRFIRWATRGGSVHPDMPSERWAAQAGVPMTYVWGEHDVFGTPGHGRAFAASIGADFVEIADAGHLPWIDRPEQTAEAILAALDASRALSPTDESATAS